MKRSNTEKTIRVLLLADSEVNAELPERELRAHGIDFVSEYTSDWEVFIRSLTEFQPDIIIAECGLSGFDSMAALKTVRRDYPEIPFIMISDGLSDNHMDWMHVGAKDYVLKNQLSRLPQAVLHALSVEKGIRKRKAEEKELRDSDELFQSILSSAQDAIILLDSDGCIILWNRAAENIFGYTANEVLGRKLHTLVVPSRYQENHWRGFYHFQKTGSGATVGQALELEALRKDGSEFPIELSISAIKLKGKWHSLGILRDISLRKHSIEALRTSRDLLSTIIENAPIRVFWKDTQLRYLGCNTAFAHDAGLSCPEDLLGKDDFEMGWHDQAEKYRTDDQKVIDFNIPKLGYEEQQTKPDGNTAWVRTSKVPLHDASGKVFGMLGIYEDITERKQATDRAASLSQVVENSLDEVYVFDAENWKFLMVNRGARQNLGYSMEEMKQLTPLDIKPEFTEESFRELVTPLLNQEKELIQFETTHQRKDGTPYPVEVHIQNTTFQGSNAFLAMILDISKRRKYESELMRLNRVLKTLSEGNHTMLHASNESELMQNICDVIVNNSDYLLAWIGFAQQDESKGVKPMAISGEGHDYVLGASITWDESPSGSGPAGTAIRTGETQLAQDIQSDPRMRPWRDSAMKYGYASIITLPLRIDKKTVGALMIYSSIPDAFSPDEVALLEEVASDLSFGIADLHARRERSQAIKEREKYAERLRSSLEEALQAIAATVEMRDPYTAGHQRRVADLAVAIAREMHLPEEQVHGIHLAGTVHDLGKIHIPSEILSKPGKLGDIEFSLIKTHCQAGFDILKGIEFPWPIAQAVLQHHERLDGSGYPQGLKDGEIILEAKILAVADVMEAISSHRPYRAALGIDVALDEIRKNRGITYDPEVVDTCIRLFVEMGYRFPDIK